MTFLDFNKMHLLGSCVWFIVACAGRETASNEQDCATDGGDCCDTPGVCRETGPTTTGDTGTTGSFTGGTLDTVTSTGETCWVDSCGECHSALVDDRDVLGCTGPDPDWGPTSDTPDTTDTTYTTDTTDNTGTTK